MLLADGKGEQLILVPLSFSSPGDIRSSGNRDKALWERDLSSITFVTGHHQLKHEQYLRPWPSPQAQYQDL